MARKSSLNDTQWAEVEKRLIAGEKGRALAREYGISESYIRKRCGAQSAQIKAVANQVIAAETAFKSLPVSAQVSAQSLIDELRAVSYHLAGAAKFGAMTAHRLNGIANTQANQLDDVEPDPEKLLTVARLSAASNEAAKTGLNLLNANRERIKSLDDLDPPIAGHADSNLSPEEAYKRLVG